MLCIPLNLYIFDNKNSIYKRNIKQTKLIIPGGRMLQIKKEIIKYINVII